MAIDDIHAHDAGGRPLALGLGALNAPRAQPPQPAPLAEWELDWTVLTMGPDGSWGVATDMWTHRAIARAIGECKAMSGATLGCGAHFTHIREGWSLGIRCGRENIVVAEKTLAEAERSALKREIELRQHYVPNMPACVRVVTVDPNGAIVAPKVGLSGRFSPTR